MADLTLINFYTATISSGTPSQMQPCTAGQGSILGENGKRYAVIQINPAGGNSHYPVIYCYDTNTVLFYGASEGFAASVTKMQADLTTLALSGAPAASGFTFIDETFAIANTAEFIVMGQSGSASGDYLAFIRYKLNSSGVITLVDGFIVRCSGNFSGRYHEINWRGITNQALVVDCRIIGSTLYIAGSGQSFTANIFDTLLLAFPLATFGTCNATVGSYDAFVTALAHGPNFLWPFSPGYINGQRGCIVQVGPTVGLLAYAGSGSITNSTWGNAFFSGGANYTGNPRLIFSGDAVAYTDYGTNYGIPFSDTLYNFAGTLTSNISNDYNGPSLITHAGHDYLLFTRIYNDANTEMRFKLVSWSGVKNLVFDWSGTYFDNSALPAAPGSFAPVNMYLDPVGGEDLILQSDFLNEAATGTWRLYADFAGSTIWPTLQSNAISRSRVWGNDYPFQAG